MKDHPTPRFLDPTVIQAQPGYFRAWPVWTESGNEVIELSLQPIIAWVVRPSIYEYGDARGESNGPQHVTPVTLDGMTDDEENEVIIASPDGKFHLAHRWTANSYMQAIEFLNADRASS
ncbi:hypothetical protein [Microvirga sp. Mcv34]|uniref:hypothetical protein n=1 Tax=Microvirga sp. Mcv34 TaxID=2926016 RepID=UPI0021C94EF8|nr:hypothetical protein [Microvirga sp. Mcv34]